MGAYIEHMRTGQRNGVSVCVASDAGGLVALSCATDGVGFTFCAQAEKARELARMLTEAADTAEARQGETA